MCSFFRSKSQNHNFLVLKYLASNLFALQNDLTTSIFFFSSIISHCFFFSFFFFPSGYLLAWTSVAEIKCCMHILSSLLLPALVWLMMFDFCLCSLRWTWFSTLLAYEFWPKLCCWVRNQTVGIDMAKNNSQIDLLVRLQALPQGVGRGAALPHLSCDLGGQREDVWETHSWCSSCWILCISKSHDSRGVTLTPFHMNSL